MSDTTAGERALVLSRMGALDDFTSLGTRYLVGIIDSGQLRGLIAQVDSLEARLARVVKALEEARQSHLIVDDCWYSCPKALEDGRSACCNDQLLALGTCTCGADGYNERIDQALAELRGQEGGQGG